MLFRGKPVTRKISNQKFYELFADNSISGWTASGKFITGGWRLDNDMSVTAARELLIPVVRGEKSLPAPLKLRLHGEVRTDVIGGFAYSFLFITDPVVKLLNEMQFTGWGTYPVEIVGEIQPAEPIYGLTILGRVGPWVTKKAFDIKNWDGRDFCTSDRGCPPLVTERVVTAFETAKITGIIWQNTPAAGRAALKQIEKRG